MDRHGAGTAVSLEGRGSEGVDRAAAGVRARSRLRREDTGTAAEDQEGDAGADRHLAEAAAVARARGGHISARIEGDTAYPDCFRRWGAGKSGRPAAVAAGRRLHEFCEAWAGDQESHGKPAGDARGAGSNDGPVRRADDRTEDGDRGGRDSRPAGSTTRLRECAGRDARWGDVPGRG